MRRPEPSPGARRAMAEHNLSAFSWSVADLLRGAGARAKELFGASPDLRSGLTNAIIEALDAHTLMSTQALNSSQVQSGLLDILLNHAGLWEALKQRAAAG